jgi:PleD family two-component response regulator
MDWVPTFSEGLASIARNEHDAFLIDHHLGGQTGVDLVREARGAGSLAALIMLTGQRDRTTDMAAMNAGATDFLMKSRTDAALLDRTLRYSISQAAMMSALERSRNQIAALEIARERRVAEEQLSKARPVDLLGHVSSRDALIDRETAAYRRALLEPLIDVAMVSTGAHAVGKVGLLIVACEDTPGAVGRLAKRSAAVCVNRPLVRLDGPALAVLLVDTDQDTARAEAGALVALARTAGLVVWGGYAALAPGWSAHALVAAAEASLKVAQSVGPGNLIG